MRRINLTTLDGHLGWFDRDTAESWDEDTYWNGNNTISCATGSQWEHEVLYRTKSGRWVVEHQSAWAGAVDNWQEITHEAAARWLLRNHHDEPLVEAEIAALEV